MATVIGKPGHSQRELHREAVDTFLKLEGPEEPGRAPQMPSPPRRRVPERKLAGGIKAAVGSVLVLIAGAVFGLIAVFLLNVIQEIIRIFVWVTVPDWIFISVLSLIGVVCLLIIWGLVINGLGGTEAQQKALDKEHAESIKEYEREKGLAEQRAQMHAKLMESYEQQKAQLQDAQQAVKDNYPQALEDPTSIPDLGATGRKLNLNHFYGLQGELVTAERLDRLDNGYYVWHDIQIPGTEANLDHLVIGPCGIVNVDAKSYRGTVSLAPAHEHQKWLETVGGSHDSRQNLEQYVASGKEAIPQLAMDYGEDTHRSFDIVRTSLFELRTTREALAAGGAQIPEHPHIVMISLSRGRVADAGVAHYETPLTSGELLRVELCTDDLAARIQALPRVLTREQVIAVASVALRDIKVKGE